MYPAKYLFFIVFVLMFSACTNQQHAQNSEAKEILDQAIQAHGMGKISNSKVSFDFRNKKYVAERNGGLYVYHRTFSDTLGNEIEDVLSNKGFERFINGDRVEIEKKKANAYGSSVNSVVYFALLPYFLNDEAVNKEKIGEVKIKDQSYHKIKVTFQQEGGGEDFEDQYIYWIHKDRFTVDYLAYNYQVNGGGARFREAYNVRNINGVRIADYVNYKPREKTLEVQRFDALFENGGLEELSRIETENVEITFRE